MSTQACSNIRSCASVPGERNMRVMVPKPKRGKCSLDLIQVHRGVWRWCLILLVEHSWGLILGEGDEEALHP